MPLISVIIPAHNAEKTIRETIDSVLDQTFPDFELIIINDNSTDSTLEVSENIQDSRVKVFSYKNGSAAGSRNRGFSHASGEFISFLDADDIWLPEKLEKQLSALQNNPQAALAYSWIDRIDEFGAFLGKGSRVSATGNVLPRLLLSNFINNGSNPLIRKEALLEAGGFDETLSNAEDWEMYLRLAARYEFVVVPYPHVLYRVTQTSKSWNFLKMEASLRKIVQNFFADPPKSVTHLEGQCFASCYRYLIFRALETKGFWKRNSIVFKLFSNYIINTPGRSRFLYFKWLLASVIFYDDLSRVAQKESVKKKIQTLKSRLDHMCLSFVSVNS